MHTVQRDAVEVFRRPIGSNFLKAYAQTAPISGNDFVVTVHFSDVNFLAVETDESEITARRNFAPAAGSPVEHVHDTGPKVIVKEGIRIVEHGDAADIFSLDVNTPRIVVGIGSINAITIFSNFKFHVNDIGRRRISDVDDFAVCRCIFNGRI